MRPGVTVTAQVLRRGEASADADNGVRLLSQSDLVSFQAGGDFAGDLPQVKAPGAQTRSSHRALADTP